MASAPNLRDLLNHPHYPALRAHKKRVVSPDHLDEVGAHAMGIGRKRTGGESFNRLALIYYVEAKVHLGDLPRERRIPKQIRSKVRGEARYLHLATDIVVRPRASYQNFNPQARHRPIPGGVSIGLGDRKSPTSGTLGGWVRDATDGEVVMLSNQHIFRDDGGVAVLQQSIGDFGVENPPVGKVKRSVRITKKSRCDCAIASVQSAKLVDNKVVGIGCGVHAVAKGKLDLHVTKYGSASQLTTGRVTDADWTGRVDDDFFEDCLFIESVSRRKPWSIPGDSGSLVFGRDVVEEKGFRPAVGLHFAGDGSSGIACRIEHVFADLKLEVLPPPPKGVAAR